MIKNNEENAIEMCVWLVKWTHYCPIYDDYWKLLANKKSFGLFSTKFIERFLHFQIKIFQFSVRIFADQMLKFTD